MNVRTLVPNLLTLTNLFLGFIAIIFIAQHRYLDACWLIIIATIFDGLDGLAARLFRISSKFGANFDSFADAVSFGLAPALLIYFAVLQTFGTIGILLSFGYLATGIFRLTKFNLTPKNTYSKNIFAGIPIPAAALIMAGFYLNTWELRELSDLAPVYMSLVPALSLLMISPFPYRKVPVFPMHSCRYSLISRLCVLTMTGLVIWNPARFIFPIMAAYLVTGPVEWVYHLLRRTKHGLNGSEELPDDPFDPDPENINPHRRNNL